MPHAEHLASEDFASASTLGRGVSRLERLIGMITPLSSDNLHSLFLFGELPRFVSRFLLLH
jgi:hypothetical protein